MLQFENVKSDYNHAYFQYNTILNSVRFLQLTTHKYSIDEKFNLSSNSAFNNCQLSSFKPPYTEYEDLRAHV